MSQRIGNQLEFDPVQPSNFHSSFQPRVKLFPFGLVSSLSGQRNRDGVSRSTVHHPLVSSDKISHTTFASRFLKNRSFLLSVTPNGRKVTYEWTDCSCDGRYFFFYYRAVISVSILRKIIQDLIVNEHSLHTEYSVAFRFILEDLIIRGWNIFLPTLY